MRAAKIRSVTRPRVATLPAARRMHRFPAVKMITHADRLRSPRRRVALRAREAQDGASRRVPSWDRQAQRTRRRRGGLLSTRSRPSTGPFPEDRCPASCRPSDLARCTGPEAFGSGPPGKGKECRARSGPHFFPYRPGQKFAGLFAAASKEVARSKVARGPVGPVHASALQSGCGSALGLAKSWSPPPLPLRGSKRIALAAHASVTSRPIWPLPVCNSAV